MVFSEIWAATGSYQVTQNVCLASSDLLHTRLALAGMHFDYLHEYQWYYCNYLLLLECGLGLNPSWDDLALTGPT